MPQDPSTYLSSNRASCPGGRSPAVESNYRQQEDKCHRRCHSVRSGSATRCSSPEGNYGISLQLDGVSQIHEQELNEAGFGHQRPLKGSQQCHQESPAHWGQRRKKQHLGAKEKKPPQVSQKEAA